jgi:hypothetical protein
MKENHVTLWGKLRSILCCGALVVLLAGCLDDDGYDYQPVPVAFVSLYHASPDAPGLDIVVDGRRINTQGVEYSTFIPYQNFYTGKRDFTFNAHNAANALIDTTFSFTDNKYYSVFIVDSVSDIEALITTDSSSAPASGKAKVRFVHLSPDAPAFDISVKGSTDAPLFTGTSFKEASEFTEITADSYAFEVKDSGNKNVILTSNDVTLQPGRHYTILVRGFETPPSGNTNGLSLQVVNN